MNRNSKTLTAIVVAVVILLCVLLGLFCNSLSKRNYADDNSNYAQHNCEEIKKDCYENKNIYMKVGETENVRVEVSTADKVLKKTTVDWQTDKSDYLKLGNPCVEDDSHISIDVEALKEGEVVLTAMATCDASEYVTFTFIISEEEKTQEEPKPQKVVTSTKVENKTQTASKVYVSSIDVSPKDVNLQVGESKAVSAIVNPSNATNKGISWKSNNTSVAKVSQDGLITAVGAGNTTVTATATDRNSVVAVINVSVTKPNITTNTNKEVLVKSITLNPTKVKLEVGESETVIATVKPTNATDKDILWESSNTSVAKVNQDGRITGVGRGSATVTAKATDGSGIVGKVNVTVTKSSYTDDYCDDEVYVSSITVSPTRLELEVGETEVATAKVKPSNATDKDLEWYSHNTSVAKVNQNGKITAVGVGYTTITVKATDGSRESATIDVTVRANEDVVVTPSDNKAPIVELTGADNVAIGEKITLTVRAIDENLKSFEIREADLLGLTGGASISNIKKLSNNTYEITLMGVEVSSLGLCVREGVARDVAGNTSSESNEVIVFINSGE